VCGEAGFDETMMRRRDEVGGDAAGRDVENDTRADRG
jgi:hypothetical protein